MRRLAVGAVVVVGALVAAPAEAGCAIRDAAGDATLSDGAVLGGAYDRPVHGPSLDIVEARAVPGRDVTTFSVRVVDLANLAVEAPTGAAYSWTAETRDRTVFVIAWSAPTGTGVSVYAGRTLMDAKFVTRAAGPRVDVARDTVTFSAPSSALGLRPGTPVASTVRSYRDVSVEVQGDTFAQSSAADHATADGRPAWGRC